MVRIATLEFRADSVPSFSLAYHKVMENLMEFLVRENILVNFIFLRFMTQFDLFLTFHTNTVEIICKILKVNLMDRAITEGNRVVNWR